MRWPQAWIFLAELGGLGLVSGFTIAKRDPVLLRDLVCWQAGETCQITGEFLARVLVELIAAMEREQVFVRGEVLALAQDIRQWFALQIRR